MALPFVSPPSRSPLAFINLVADAVVSLANKLVTASGLSAWIAARSTALTAPTTADGGRLVREADCTTAANAANPVLSVGGLTARSVSAPGVVAGTKLLTQADRPVRAKLTGNSRVLSAAGVGPAWANWAAAEHFNLSSYGGAAKFSATMLYGGIRIYQTGVGTVIVQLIADSTSAVVASVTTASAAGYQTAAWSAFTLANMTAGAETYSIRAQIATGAPGNCVVEAWSLALQDV